MKKLEWYAFYQESNTNKLKYANVLYDRLIDNVKKLIRKNADYDEIKKEIDISLMSRYWSRCEYEVVVSNWAGKDFEQKIDVYYQLQPNLDRITEYVIRELAPRKCNEILKKR